MSKAFSTIKYVTKHTHTQMLHVILSFQLVVYTEEKKKICYVRDIMLMFKNNFNKVYYVSQALRKKERDYEHEMERLAREKIAAQQRLVALRKELNATWDPIDINSLLLEQNPGTDVATSKNGEIRDVKK